MSTKNVLERCNPNRHGEVRLVEWVEPATASYDGETLYTVTQPGESDSDGSEFLNREDAKKFYDEVVTRLSKTPNWEAQAAYDAEHGTINGYGAHQFGREY